MTGVGVFAGGGRWTGCVACEMKTAALRQRLAGPPAVPGIDIGISFNARLGWFHETATNLGALSQF